MLRLSFLFVTNRMLNIFIWDREEEVVTGRAGYRGYFFSGTGEGERAYLRRIRCSSRRVRF